ncbi:hypothetical protein [Shinella zoogloeoides]|uniref:hypothetical protein n=1 Tax=Shinella zoogloeoides TaxID=352475 RepID=UPI0028A71658|nr:hypothetical protein [Shinella zoogloeoides]
MDKLAISATFVDYRRIKGRKVHQIIFEVPSEKWQETYSVLGEPSIETSDWFAIAKMQGIEPEKAKGGRLAQRAGILSNEGGFAAFAAEKFGKEPVALIYDFCGVASRAHLDHDESAAAKFHELTREYDAWRIAS